jgi:shikimate dehydrogenase
LSWRDDIESSSIPVDWVFLQGLFMPSIDANTKVCALFGHPVGHSLSPAMHNGAFEALGLPYVYVAHDVQPGCVARALDGVRVMGYRGLSVTIPHKVEAMRGVDRVDATAQGIGCINTVVNENGQLVGYNSDGRGALNALCDAGADPLGKRVLMLGSGGAARAIAMTLVVESPPERLDILGVQPDELERLVADARQYGKSAVEGGALNDHSLGDHLVAADLLLHCSPIGMHPHEDASLVRPELLRPELAVFDAVYNPRRTKLLKDAKAAGCLTIEGIEMFLGQAYVQFELWTGHPAPRKVMRQVVEAEL